VSRCVVKENIANGVAGSLDNRIICSDGSVLILPGVVPVGSEIVFDSYYENDDTTTLHGYVKRVYDPVQEPRSE
jgi:hypothetical protein